MFCLLANPKNEELKKNADKEDYKGTLLLETWCIAEWIHWSMENDYIINFKELIEKYKLDPSANIVSLINYTSNKGKINMLTYLISKRASIKSTDAY